MTPIPDRIAHNTPFSRFLRSKYFWAFVSTLALNAVSVIDRLLNWKKSTAADGWTNTGLLIGVGLAAIVGIASLFRLWKEFATEHVEAPSLGLQAALLIVLNGLKSEHKKGPDPCLRFCVHVLDSKKNTWIQRTDYVGICAGTGRGRVQPISKGVVGEALRTGKITCAKVKNGQNRVDLLVAQGYTHSEVAEMRSDTLSWIAVPIAHPDRPTSPFAVLYGDASVADFFDGRYAVRKKILEACVIGIAEFCKPTGKGW